jgi:hypothetical protein
MMISEIMLGLLAFSFLLFLWVFVFFIFDAEILNGYFKRKLQQRFKVEE